MRWLRKAILRAAGIIPLRDEARTIVGCIAVAVDITAPAAAVARILRLDCIAFAPVEKNSVTCTVRANCRRDGEVVAPCGIPIATVFC